MIYLFNIIFYSIIGFIYETILKIIGSFNYDSGFMYGPYTLIYGLGITLMFFIFDNIKTISKIKRVIIFFVLSFIIISTLEFVSGALIESFFNLVYWNYTEYPLNIGKYISIPTSLFWSIGIVAIYFFIKPLTDKLYLKIPKIVIKIISAIILIDFIITLFFKLKLQ